ncbi:alcohol dehydrogenase catalytic domain-containing protein [Nocardia sp. NPDC005978]|uniref:zinc-dependent alcohol dehydrogenase n=1 Tax=Nocardia sp. NPDC005978 TaxID=3156725 RepID=UPI0033AADE45
MSAVVGAGGVAELRDVPVPVRRPGWVRLRVLGAAICRTDVYAATGRLPLGGPRVLGHEMVGEVVEADPEGDYRPGARVAVATPLIACAECESAARRCGESRMLGVDLDGAFAEQTVVPEANLWPVPESLPLRRAACVEPIAATTAVLRAPIRPDQRGVVLGAGRIAELSGRVLRAHGFGSVDDEVDAKGDYDFVIESAGTGDALARAVALARPGGVVVLKSRPAAPIALDVAAAVRKDLVLAAVSYGPAADAVRLAGELAIDDLLGETYPLRRFADALAAAERDPLGPKVLLDPAGAR